MEPVTAIGAISSCITIIQSGLELILEIKEVYHSETGARRITERLVHTASDLDSACNNLQATLRIPEDSHVELCEIADKCGESARKLQQLLQELKAAPRKRDAVMKTIKAKWKQNEIDELQKEVNEYRQALNTRLLVLIGQQTLPNQHRQSPVKSRSALDTEFANVMKHALWFPEMHQRQQRIRDVHPETFQWIFEDPDESGEPWDSFISWLREGQGAYWLNGKAGSGKSTLMNYVSNEKRTVDALKEWSGATKPIIARFFFWSSGSELEKSVQGMYRTLLYQILDQSHDSASVLFPDEDPDQMTNLVSSNSRDSYWTEKKLTAALQQLAVSSVDKSFCLFVDGLDEFAGDHELLIELIQILTSRRNIKVCASSRPLRTFTQSFVDHPQLRLQDLTAGDIHNYIDDELTRIAQGRDFAEIQASNYKHLLSDILRKASGVFLWVRLVVRSLQEGLRNGDNLDELQTRLDDLPDDLLSLFRTMITALEPRYLAKAGKVFRTVFAAPDPDRMMETHSPSLSILDLLVAEEVSVARARAHPIGKTNWENVKTRVVAFEQQLANTCCGLLEFTHGHGRYRGDWIGQLVPDASEIISTTPHLLHQSVREFLTEQNTSPPFSVKLEYADYERLLAARVITVKSLLGPGLSKKAIHDLADYGLSIAKHMETQIGRTNTVLVDEIDRSCAACARMNFGSDLWLSPKNHTGKDIVEALSNTDVRGNDDAPHDPRHEAILADLNIVSYASVFGLFLYAKERLSNDATIAKITDKVPLLHVMLIDESTERETRFASPSWLDLLQMVLACGGNPNLQYNGRSAWETRLGYQADEIEIKAITRLPDDIELFIKHGADCNQELNYRGLLAHEHLQGPFTRVTKQVDCSTAQADADLYTVLQAAMEREKLVKKEDGAESSSPFRQADLYLFMKMVFAQTASEKKRNQGGTKTAEAVQPDPLILAFPTWRVSLLYWSQHCLVQTKQVKMFSQSLIDNGATEQEPRIVAMMAYPGGVGDKESEFLSRSLSEEESTRFTKAWWEAFPDYIIAGYPRELHRLLSLLSNKADLETFGMGNIPVADVCNGILEVLAAGQVPTTGEILNGETLDPMTEACMRLIGALEVMLKYSDRLGEIGGLGGLMGIAGPQDMSDAMSGESESCALM